MSTIRNSKTSDGCELERFERNHYFNGKLLTARDLADEQAYHVERLATLARYVLGDGLVCGLTVQVSHSAGEEDMTVELSEGLALDCCGNLVVVKDGTSEDITPPSGVNELHLYLKYRECFRESVPVPNSGDACEEECAYNRVLEIYELVAEPAPLGDDDPSSIGPVSFPRENELAERESAESLDSTDSELLRIAQSYDAAEHATCADCDDPYVYLCALERSGDIWQKVDDSDRSHLVYTNEMLYAAIARHTADFRNPHGTSLAVLAGESVPNTTGARIHVEDEATDAEAVTLTSRSEYVELSATPNTKTIELTTPDITDLANQVDGLETDVTDLETDVTTLETEVTDLQTDVAENEADIDRLERYVMDKTLKYKLKCFERLAERFDGTIAGDVAAAVVQRTWDGIDGQVYEDPDEFREFLGESETHHTFDREGIKVEEGLGNELIVTFGEHQFTIIRDEYDGNFEEMEGGFEAELTLVELEKLVGDALSGLAESPRETTYEEAVSELEEALAGNATPLDIATAQDLVCETTEWLEPTTEEGNLTVDLSSEVIAANVEDSITVSGTARGQGDDVRIYLVDPEGGYRTASGGTGAESVSVENEQFEMTYTTFDETGGYVFLVVGSADDGYTSEIGFSPDEELPSGQSHEEAIDTVLKAYDGGGDVIVDSVLTVESPSLTIDDFGSVRRGLPFTVTGTSNREDGTTVLVEVLSQAARKPIDSQETKVRGVSNNWVANFDLSNASLGQYSLRATDSVVSASHPFRLISLIPPIDRPPIDFSDPPIDRPIHHLTDIDSERDAEVEVVDGIGPTRSERLRDANVTMLSDLVAADSEQVANAAGVSTETAKKWLAAAWEHLSE